MQITLHLDGKENTFQLTFVKSRMFRKALELRQEIDFDDITPEQLDILVGFVCELFDKQFSIDDFYDGLPSENMMPVIMESFDVVSGPSEGSGKK